MKASGVQAFSLINQVLLGRYATRNKLATSTLCGTLNGTHVQFNSTSTEGSREKNTHFKGTNHQPTSKVAAKHLLIMDPLPQHLRSAGGVLRGIELDLCVSLCSGAKYFVRTTSNHHPESRDAKKADQIPFAVVYTLVKCLIDAYVPSDPPRSFVVFLSMMNDCRISCAMPNMRTMRTIYGQPSARSVISCLLPRNWNYYAYIQRLLAVLPPVKTEKNVHINMQ